MVLKWVLSVEVVFFIVEIFSLGIIILLLDDLMKVLFGKVIGVFWGVFIFIMESGVLKLIILDSLVAKLVGNLLVISSIWLLLKLVCFRIFIVLFMVVMGLLFLIGMMLGFKLFIMFKMVLLLLVSGVMMWGVFVNIISVVSFLVLLCRILFNFICVCIRCEGDKFLVYIERERFIIIIWVWIFFCIVWGNCF